MLGRLTMFMHLMVDADDSDLIFAALPNNKTAAEKSCAPVRNRPRR
jgi:hypothetical protein